MAARWFCLRDSMEIGPFAWAQIKQMAASGLIRAEDQLRTDLEPQWKPAAANGELFVVTPVKPAVVAKAIMAAQPTVAPPVVVNTAPLRTAIPSGQVVTTVPPLAKPITPVVKAVTIPSGVPMGQPVPSAPPIPVGSVPASQGFTFVEAPPLDPKTSAAARGVTKKKSNTTNLLIMGGVASIALVGLLLWAMNAARSTSEREAAKTTSKPAEKPVAPKSETLVKSPDALNVAANATVPQENPLAVIKAVKQWNVAGPGRTVKLKAANSAVEVVKFWFAANAAGTEIVSMPGADAIDPAAANFVFVEVMLSNIGEDAAVAYQGWNAGAVLTNAANEPLATVASDATPDVVRRGAAAIPAHGSTNDTLVFAWSGVPQKQLKLALPHKNLGVKSTGAFGFDLATIAEKPKSLAEQQPAVEVLAGETPAPVVTSENTAEAMPDEKMKPEVPSKTKNEVDEVDDLVKKLEREAKAAEAAEAALKKRLEEEALKKKE